MKLVLTSVGKKLNVGTTSEYRRVAFQAFEKSQNVSTGVEMAIPIGTEQEVNIYPTVYGKKNFLYEKADILIGFLIPGIRLVRTKTEEYEVINKNGNPQKLHSVLSLITGIMPETTEDQIKAMAIQDAQFQLRGRCIAIEAGLDSEKNPIYVYSNTKDEQEQYIKNRMNNKETAETV